MNLSFITYIRKVGLIYLIPFVLFLIDFLGLRFLFGYLLIGLMFLSIKKLSSNFDRDFVFIAFFCLSYASFYFFSLESGVQFILIYALFPCMFYLFGKYLVLRNMHTEIIVGIFFL